MRKDYVKFATMLRELERMRRPGQISIPFDTLELVKRFTADIFANDSARFDREKFYRACEPKE